MTRQEQIKEAARQRADQYDHPSKWSDTYYGFIDGAKWADKHPQWYDAQGDNVPEYGREVIVIGRDGKVFFGHRPDPKEVTMVEGKPYHAKTYDKNGCCHQWKQYTRIEIFEEDAAKRPVEIREILVCTKCGKFKKITL